MKVQKEMNTLTGKSKRIKVLDKEITYFNQNNSDWTHPYAYDDPEDDLALAGCGIFSLCVAAEVLTGIEQSPEVWADFSCANGGRGDDGTDRPVLLAALQNSGNAEKLGFYYEFDGLRNDNDALYDMLLKEEGVAFCNLRVGHIVALIAAREVDGVKQVLAIDSVAESDRESVREHVTEVIEGSENTHYVRNKSGIIVGTSTSYGAFWVKADLPKDFNLLHRIK